MKTWRKEKFLGAGSYGTVYLAGHYYDSDSSDPLALIAVKSSVFPFISSLQKEGQFLYELRGCPEIIRCYGDDICNDVYSLLLEYASDGTLSDLIKKFNGYKMPESEIARYCQMLLKGLSHVHQEGFVHCDIKPSNILVFPSFNHQENGSNYHRLKIADFGLAKKITEKTRVRGTPLYASPESVAYGVQEPSSDIWSFGCVVAEMFIGTPLWKRSPNSSMKELFDNILHGEIKIPGDISSIGLDFLNKCLTRDTNERWTANMLLNHPFILQNLTASHQDQRVSSSHSHNNNNPFELSQWSSTLDLFLTDQVERVSASNHCLDASHGLVRNMFKNLAVN